MTKPKLNLLTIQTTMACNLRCLYCYQDADSFKSHEKISIDVVKRLVDDLITYHVSINSTEPISITFHGGEPLLLGHKFYRDALTYLRTLDDSIRKDKFSLAVQTNLTLLDQQFCDIFKEHNVNISTSIDGPAQFHNKFRDPEGADNHATVMRHVDLARKSGLNVGAICIITADKLLHAQDIYDFFCMNSMNFKTNPPFLHGQAYKNRNQVEITVAEYVDFMKSLFDIWYTNKPTVIIENLFELIGVVLRGAGAGSCFNSNCSAKHITVAPDGECFTCGRTTVDRKFSYGNIMHTSIDVIANSKTLRYFTDRVPDRISECSGCSFRHVCFSGCMYEAYLKTGTIYSPDRNCEAFKALFTHIRERIEADLVLQNRKDGQNGKRNNCGWI